MAYKKPQQYGLHEYVFEDLKMMPNPPFELDDDVYEMMKMDTTAELYEMENLCKFPIENVGFFSARLIDKCTPKATETEAPCPIEVEGDPKNIFELEKELVFKILDDLNVEVDQDAKKRIRKGKDAKYEALYHYSLGLALEDKDDYKAAYAEYNKALKIAPGYAEAEMKKNKLEPMALKG